MNKFELAYNEIIGAKSVTMKDNRTCRKCNKTILKGSKAITACHLSDKKYNITFKECVDKNLRTNNYKFVSVRHWYCEQCYNILKNTKICKNRLNITKNELEDIIYSDEFGKLSARAQLDKIKTFYANGLITSSEYDYFENELINTIALEEAQLNEV